jgi:hypothetical protein
MTTMMMMIMKEEVLVKVRVGVRVRVIKKIGLNLTLNFLLDQTPIITLTLTLRFL